MLKEKYLLNISDLAYLPAEKQNISFTRTYLKGKGLYVGLFPWCRPLRWYTGHRAECVARCWYCRLSEGLVSGSFTVTGTLDTHNVEVQGSHLGRPCYFGNSLAQPSFLLTSIH